MYKHFESKQQIFDEIIAESQIKYKEFLAELAVHFTDSAEKSMDKKDVDVYSSISAQGLCDSVLAFVRYSMKDPYSKQVRHMLTISQFESRQLGEMYTQRYVSAMLGYDEKLFEQLMKAKAIKRGDPKHLALMFYAPVIMYMGIWDREPKKAKECEESIKDHIERFYDMTKSV